MSGMENLLRGQNTQLIELDKIRMECIDSLEKEISRVIAKISQQAKVIDEYIKALNKEWDAVHSDIVDDCCGEECSAVCIAINRLKAIAKSDSISEGGK